MRLCCVDNAVGGKNPLLPAAIGVPPVAIEVTDAVLPLRPCDGTDTRDGIADADGAATDTVSGMAGDRPCRHKQ